MATNETIFTHSAQTALRLLPKIHGATAQMLYAHEKGQLEDANQLAFDAERQVEKLVNSYRMIPTFPDLRFEMHYEEPGCFFAGDVLCEGEDFDITEYDDAQCRELFACEDDD